MTIDITMQMLECSTPMQLWDAAHDLSGANTRARITLYKSEFQWRRTRKGTMRMEEYLNKIKSIVDKLHLASNPLSMDDLVTQH